MPSPPTPFTTRNIQGVHSQQSSSPLIKYLLQDPVFEELCKVKKEGWGNEKANTYWQKRKTQALKADERAQRAMFNMMRNIGTELDEKTGAFTLPIVPDDAPAPTVLDLALAPGGFSSCLLDFNARCDIDAFTLPEDDGGHAIRVAPDPRLAITEADVTMLASELGTQLRDIPDDSPNAEKLRASVWPYGRKQYDLVVADGKVPDKASDAADNHNSFNACAYREAVALRAAQFALALTKLKPGGTLVMLSFRPEGPQKFRAIHKLSNMCDSVEMFKPKRWHTIKSSFYIVAKGIRTQSDECRRMVDENLHHWHRAVVLAGTDRPSGAGDNSDGGSHGARDSNDGDGDGDATGEDAWYDDADVTDEELVAIIREFGEEFKKMARPVWKVQIHAMRKKWAELGGKASQSDVAAPDGDGRGGDASKESAGLSERRRRIMGLGSWRKDD